MTASAGAVQVPGGRGMNGRFTLVEMLVVIAIISILCALLLPSLVGARQMAVSMQCKSNVRGIGSAMMIYASDNNSMLLPALVGSDMAAARWYTNLLVGGGYIPDSPWVYGSRAYGDVRTGIWRCPEVTQFQQGGGYAVNYSYLVMSTQNAGYPLALARLRSPSAYWLTGDMQDKNGKTALFINATVNGPLEPMPCNRHLGAANHVLVDLHVGQIDYDLLKQTSQFSVLGKLFYSPNYR